MAEQLGGFMEFCIALSTQSNGELETLTPQFLYQGLMVVLKTVMPIMAATQTACPARTIKDSLITYLRESIATSGISVMVIKGNGWGGIFALALA